MTKPPNYPKKMQKRKKGFISTPFASSLLWIRKNGLNYFRLKDNKGI
jgi:hypothetical protein